MSHIVSWQAGVLAAQIIVLALFGLLRSRMHTGSGVWRGRLPRLNGFIEPIACRAVIGLSWLSDAIVGSRLVSQTAGARSPTFRRRNGFWIDGFVLLCVLLVLASYWGIILSPQDSGVFWMLVLPVWRLVDVLAVNIRINLFDHLIIRKEPSAASTTRMLILVFFNYVEIALSFGCVYAASGLLHMGSHREADWLDPVYFSWITQLTIGYGDAFPTGWVRIVAGIQGLIGLLVLVLFIGRFASSLPAIRSLHTHDSDEPAGYHEDPEHIPDA